MRDMLYQFGRKTKVLGFCLLILVSCLTVVACGGGTATTGNGTIVVATENDYPPFDFLRDGEHVGYNQALLDLVQERIPQTIDQQVLPWQGILTGLASGQYDLTNAAVAMLEDRVDSLDFTMPITEFTNYYVKRAGDMSISSIEDFSGKRVGVQQGGVTLQVLEDVVNEQLAEMGADPAQAVEYEAFSEAYQDLENQRLDAVINNVVALAELTNERPETFELGTQVGDKMYAGWVVSKGNTEILEPVNAALAEIKAEGLMQQLQEEWLKVSFDDLPDKPMLPGDVPMPTN